MENIKILTYDNIPHNITVQLNFKIIKTTPPIILQTHFLQYNPFIAHITHVYPVIFPALQTTETGYIRQAYD